MPSGWTWKTLLTLVAVVGSLYLTAPSVLKMRGADEETLSRYFPNQGVNLGLDLRGGLYMELSVDLEGALNNRLNLLAAEIERFASKEKFPSIKAAPGPGRTLKIELPADQRPAFLEFVRENFGDALAVGEDQEFAGDAQTFEIKMQNTYADYLRDLTLKQAEEAVRNRIDRFGVVEASIQRQGDNRLVVELPGIQDPDRVIDVIRKTGLLEFKIVDESVDPVNLESMVAQIRSDANLPQGYTKEALDALNAALSGKIPEDSEVLFEVTRDPVTKQIVSGRPHLLKKRAEVTGDMLQNAQVNIDNKNKPYVGISFNKAGTKIFGDLTRDNVNKRLAIVLDGIISMAPVINEPILNGEAQISLGFGSYQNLLKEAEDVSLLLREGALPAALTIQTKTVIGPSLGADSIRAGIVSMLIAVAVIFIFMMLYYRLGGALASFALILNVLFIFAILSLFQASLTLPGIAGIILTMGMAVDANIIIFERMREERRLGKTARAIVESGYGNAMSAIIDSNITTMLAGIILFQFGTGPIKGFATTLMIGILTTLFTAIVVTRLAYDYFIYKRKIKTVSI